MRYRCLWVWKELFVDRVQTELENGRPSAWARSRGTDDEEARQMLPNHFHGFEGTVNESLTHPHDTGVSCFAL
jgi:hypothetical protein